MTKTTSHTGKPLPPAYSVSHEAVATTPNRQLLLLHSFALSSRSSSSSSSKLIQIQGGMCGRTMVLRINSKSNSRREVSDIEDEDQEWRPTSPKRRKSTVKKKTGTTQKKINASHYKKSSNFPLYFPTEKLRWKIYHCFPTGFIFSIVLLIVANFLLHSH